AVLRARARLVGLLDRVEAARRADRRGRVGADAGLDQVHRLVGVAGRLAGAEGGGGQGACRTLASIRSTVSLGSLGDWQEPSASASSGKRVRRVRDIASASLGVRTSCARRT